MSAAQEEIINAIQNHMSRLENNPSAWYIGIASGIRAKLFDEHKVSEQNGRWIYRTLENNSLAKEVKNYFVSKGFSSNEQDDEPGNIIFAYQKNYPLSQ